MHAPAITAAQMAEIDRVVPTEYHISVEMLMENASRAVAEAARAFFDGSVAGRRIIALVGPGNNGGDALGASRHLSNWGAEITVVLALDPQRVRPLPRTQLEALSAAGVPALRAIDDAELARAGLVLDGLLGYSATGAPHGEIASLIDAANRSRAPILAIDLPSGLDADTGTAAGACIVASLTVTLGLPKPGLLVDAAARYVGTLLLADISIPPLAHQRFNIDANGLFAESTLVRVTHSSHTKP